MKLRYIPILSILILFNLFFGIYASESEFFNKGLSYYQKNEFELASAHLEEAKKIDSSNPKIYFYLGNIYYQINELDKAILNYTTGLDFTDKKGAFFYNLGNCYFLKQNYKFSTEMYSQAVLYDPSLYDSYLNAGNAYYKAGDYIKTIIQWETYLEKYPETPQYDNIEKAIAYLREELEKPKPPPKEINEKTGLDKDLMDEVMGELDKLINRTENVLETSEEAIDDLSIQEIER